LHVFAAATALVDPTSSNPFRQGKDEIIEKVHITYLLSQGFR
jgi:hypothetical protein